MVCTYYCPAPTAAAAAAPTEAFGANPAPMDIDPDLRAAEALASLLAQQERAPTVAVGQRREAEPHDFGAEPPAKRARIEGHGMYRSYMHLPDEQFMEAMGSMLGPHMTSWPQDAQAEAMARVMGQARRNLPAAVPYGPEYQDYTSMRPSELGDWQHNVHFDNAYAGIADEGGDVQEMEWPDGAQAAEEAWHQGRRAILNRMGVGGAARSGGVPSAAARNQLRQAVEQTMELNPHLAGYIAPTDIVGGGTLGPNVQIDDIPEIRLGP